MPTYNRGIEKLNTQSKERLEAALTKCCGSSRWVALMIAKKPYGSFEHLLGIVDEVDSKLSPEDWKEAFAAHPMIGRNKGKKIKEWEAREQESTKSASDEILDSLSILNEEYAEKFGYIYIICATGKTAEEMLQILRTRLQNDHQTELFIAAAEQSKISKLRLEKLLQELSDDSKL